MSTTDNNKSVHPSSFKSLNANWRARCSEVPSSCEMTINVPRDALHLHLQLVRGLGGVHSVSTNVFGTRTSSCSGGRQNIWPCPVPASGLMISRSPLTGELTGSLVIRSPVRGMTPVTGKPFPVGGIISLHREVAACHREVAACHGDCSPVPGDSSPLLCKAHFGV